MSSDLDQSAEKHRALLRRIRNTIIIMAPRIVNQRLSDELQEAEKSFDEFIRKLGTSGNYKFFTRGLQQPGAGQNYVTALCMALLALLTDIQIIISDDGDEAVTKVQARCNTFATWMRDHYEQCFALQVPLM
jgi:hypothetical protein